MIIHAVKRFFIATAMVILALTGCKDKATEFDIAQGVNIGNWLSQSWVMGENGFDHIRLPVDEAQLFNTDMTLNGSTVDLIHKTIDCCIEHGLKVIFDLHILRSFHFLDNDVVSLCRELGIPYSMWEYNSQFGFADRVNRGVITNRPLMEVLVK